jgi:hypothetical protein
VACPSAAVGGGACPHALGDCLTNGSVGRKGSHVGLRSAHHIPCRRSIPRSHRATEIRWSATPSGVRQWRCRATCHLISDLAPPRATARVARPRGGHCQAAAGPCRNGPSRKT